MLIIMNLNLKGLTIKAKKPRIIIKNHHQCKTGFATLLQAAFLRKMEGHSPPEASQTVQAV